MLNIRSTKGNEGVCNNGTIQIQMASYFHTSHIYCVHNIIDVVLSLVEAYTTMLEAYEIEIQENVKV